VIKQPGMRAHRSLDLGVLDALRGLAALYVMLGHASGRLWSGLDDTIGSGQGGPGLAIAYVAHHLLRWPHEAVLLFFFCSAGSAFIIARRNCSPQPKHNMRQCHRRCGPF
jgi:peptidoglycan/LPS O-acetylase OafA/YrhL